MAGLLEVGTVELRITVTIERAGSEDEAERLLEAFYKTNPDVGAVVDQDLAEDVLNATFSINVADDTSLDALRERITTILVSALTESGIPYRPIKHVQLESVGDGNTIDDRVRELVPA
jgi:hypothetical protein